MNIDIHCEGVAVRIELSLHAHLAMLPPALATVQKLRPTQTMQMAPLTRISPKFDQRLHGDHAIPRLAEWPDSDKCNCFLHAIFPARREGRSVSSQDQSDGAPCNEDVKTPTTLKRRSKLICEASQSEQAPLQLFHANLGIGELNFKIATAA